MGLIKKPIYEIALDGKKLSDKLHSAAQKIELNDEAGIESDSLSIDFAGNLPHIDAGRKLAVKLGYEGEALISFGFYSIESTAWSIEKMSVSATGLNFAGVMKQKRTQTYEGLSVKEIVELIAARNDHDGLPKCDFDEIRIPYLAQTDESDMHFLRRLAKEYDALFSVKSGRIIFIKRGTETDGKDVPIYELNASDLSDLTITRKARPKYNSVQALWRENDETKSVVVGSGEPIFKLNSPFLNAQVAYLKAESKFARLRRDCFEGSFSCAGANIRAGGRLTLIGAGENSGDYEITKVTQSVSKSGWITSAKLGG
ncbi:hypothetical protein FACS189487_10940 [Campylobacterota bacterium]|nr:hypothetical protein FACS189487_10940 [Campylobacterota bacterium]